MTICDQCVTVTMPPLTLLCDHGDLDQVVVTDLDNTQWKYFFPCGQWLAKSEGDGATCRDLIGSRDPLATRKGLFVSLLNV